MTSLSPSHLDVVERRFLAMTAEPLPTTLDCAELGCGLPAAEMPLDQVRVLLLKRRTSWVTKNAVWQELVRRAHTMPEPWTTVAAAMMMPGLKHIGGKLGTRYPGERNDLDSEILEGFLQALDLAEAGTPKVHAQLYWAAFRRGHEACNRERRVQSSRADMNESTAKYRCPDGHPDIVLANAMRRGVVTPQEADLVSDVFLDHNDRTTVARQRGTSRYQVRSRLTTATRHLADHLTGETADSAA